MNSRQWRASILLVLAVLIGTSAIGSLLPRSSGTGPLAGSSVSQGPRASGEESIANLPGTHPLSFAGDQHFDVEDSRSNWQPADAGSGVISPTERISEAVFGGATPGVEPGIAEPVLSLTARARN
jgi:hypothetical protein